MGEGAMPRKTLGEAFARYAVEVSPSKRGAVGRDALSDKRVLPLMRRESRYQRRG
jgi:hypothetical protein